MSGDQKAVTRAVAVLALAVVAIVALRGSLPGAEPAPQTEPEPARGGAGGLVAMAVLTAVSVAVFALAVGTQSRRRPAAPLDLGALRAGRVRGGRPPWRLLAIAAAGLMLWLLVVALLMRWGAEVAVDGPTDGVPATETPAGTEPAPPSADDPPPEPPNPDTGNAFGVLAVAAIALFTLSWLATFLGRRRPAVATAPMSDPAPSAAPPPAGPDLARAAELGLVEIGDRSRDPREAIIACYAAMERELEKSPGTTPQASDTPSEVLARAVRNDALRADSAAGLVDLFEEARFSPHVMNEGHRADAVRALQLVLDELQVLR